MKLHTQTVSEELLKRLQALMQKEELKQFYLVGGTALALHYGHRKSIDLDLFTHSPFDSSRLQEWLVRTFGMQETTIEENTVLGKIDGIKVDLMAHRYPLLGEVIEVNGIRLLSVEDIAAMKLNAIANRGSKKDFWDYAELLKHFDHQELLGFYSKKYPNGSLWTLEKSLCYFEDAEAEPDLITLNNQTWAEVKNHISTACRLP